MATEAVVLREMLVDAGLVPATGCGRLFSRRCSMDDSATGGIIFFDIGATKFPLPERKLAVEGRGAGNKAAARGIVKAASWSDLEFCVTNRRVDARKVAGAGAGGTAAADQVKGISARAVICVTKGPEAASKMAMAGAGTRNKAEEGEGKSVNKAAAVAGCNMETAAKEGNGKLVVNKAPAEGNKPGAEASNKPGSVTKKVRVSDAYITRLQGLPPMKPASPVPESFFDEFPHLREVIRGGAAKINSLIEMEEDILNQFYKNGYAEVEIEEEVY